MFDSLTTLPNRELFLDRLGSALAMADTRSPDHQVVVLLVDVDEFRSYNSDYGLVVGDSIILTVSRRLGRIVGAGGTLARIGGDQFAIFLVGPNDPTELAAFAERVRLSLRSSIRIAGQEINLTGSVGIAIYDGTTTSARELLRDAEIAMYRAKRQSSDRAVIFTPVMQPERQERAELERDLARALEQRQLKVLYHPVVALSNDELIGFEAVMRWQHPRLGTLSPTDFLPLATETDLVTRIGSYMLGQTVRDLQRWQQELTRPERPLFAALNISSRQLLSNELIQEIRHTRSRAVLPAGSLKLAIPEALVMENPEQATHILDSLRDAGVDLWLDGFGTGYSSVSYLARFPFESFRLDRALVEWSGQGERDQAVVRSLVAIAHELGRNVIGDGVESAGDAAFLRATGCQFAQGFHYGDAMGEDEVLRLLRLIRKSERRMRRRGMVRGPEKRKGAEQPAALPAQATQPSQPTRPTQPPSVASAPQTAPVSPPAGRSSTPPTAPPSASQQRPPEPPAQGDRRPQSQPGGGTGQPHAAWPPRTVSAGAPSRPTPLKSPAPPSRQTTSSSSPANGGGDRTVLPPLPNGQRPAPADQSSQQQAPARPTQPPPVRTQPTANTPPRPAPQAPSGQPPTAAGTRSPRVVPGPTAPTRVSPTNPPTLPPTQANPQDNPPVNAGSPPTLTPFPPPQANGGARQGGVKPAEADLSQLSPSVAASLARLAGKGKKPDAAE